MTYSVGPLASGETVVRITTLGGRRRSTLSRGYDPRWGRHGVALVRGQQILLFGRPLRSRAFTVLADLSGTAEVPAIVGWSGSRLFAGRVTPATAFAAPIFRPFVVDAASGETFAFPTALNSVYAMSRDGAEVLGGVGRDLVVERRDGTVVVVARDADSASWTRY